MIPVLKKLVSLLLSLLICLPLLLGLAGAVDAPEGAPPVQTEASEAAQPNKTEDLVMPVFAGEDFPGETGRDHSEG